MRLRSTFLLGLLSLAGCASARPTTAHSNDIAANFRAIIARPAVDLNPESKPLPDYKGLSQEHVAITSEPGQVVPAIILKDKQLPAGRHPVVIVLHGTGGYKEQHRDLLATLAKRGFIAVAPDGRYHGERCAAGKGTVEYYAAIAKAYEDGGAHPWLYDTVYDVGRLIDYLQTRPDVDPARIGLMGFSKGGMETYLAAATDPRIAVAVPCISVQSYAWELQHDQWHGRISTVQGAFDAAAKHDGVPSPDATFVKKFYDRVVPGIDGPFDCPSVLPLICPRPLLTINGELDKLNPLPSTKIATDATAAAYAKAGVPERFKAEVEPKTAHAVKPEYVAEAVDWLAKWLTPDDIKTP